MHEHLIEYFTRMRRVGNHPALEIGTVRWHGPSDPYVVWHVYRIWTDEPTTAEIANATQDALHDPKFFRVCERCETRFNIGNMLGDICQGCASRYHGVVY